MKRSLPIREIQDPYTANAFVYGLVFNQGQRAERAWEAPHLLAERLGTLHPARILEHDPAELASVVAQRPALHRFPRSMARYLWGASQVLAERYGDDARCMWSPQTTAGEVVGRLREVPGIGEHKARVGLFLLTVELGVAVLADGAPYGIGQYCPSLAQRYEPLTEPYLLEGMADSSESLVHATQ